LIDIEPLEKTIALTLQSAYVANNDKAVSLVIVANPEHGKTQALMNGCIGLVKEKKVFFSNNLTSKFIETRLLNEIEDGKIRHIVIPDLLNCLERAQSTRKLFVNFMKSLIEEGIIQVGDAYHAFQTTTGVSVKCGLITAITKANMKENFYEWRNIGFLSRIITFSYSYDMLKASSILDTFLQEKNGIFSSKFNIDTNPTAIMDYNEVCPYPEFKAIALTQGKLNEEVGTRYYENLVYLARSNAKLNTRTKVEKEDVDEILRLMKWFNLGYNTL
jgi:hypothetical protein